LAQNKLGDDGVMELVEMLAQLEIRGGLKTLNLTRYERAFEKQCL